MQITSLTNLFAAPWSPQRDDDDKPEPQGSRVPGPTPWLYFNLVLTETQARAGNVHLPASFHLRVAVPDGMCPAHWWLSAPANLLPPVPHCINRGPQNLGPPDCSAEHRLLYPLPTAAPSSSPQLFVPVFDIAVAEHLAAQLWVGALGAEQRKCSFELVADLVLACMLMESMDETGERAVGGGCGCPGSSCWRQLLMARGVFPPAAGA